MSETTFYLLGIVVVAALIFVTAARGLGEFGFLLAVLLIGGGYAVVLAAAYFEPRWALAAVPATLLGILLDKASSRRDTRGPAWRGDGLHATLMAVALGTIAVFSAFVYQTTGANRGVMIAAIIGYGLAAIWYTVAALHAAGRVLREGN